MNMNTNTNINMNTNFNMNFNNYNDILYSCIKVNTTYITSQCIHIQI